MSFHSPHLLWLLAPLLLLFSWELARRAAGAASHLPKVARAWAGAFAVSLGNRHSTADTRARVWLWFGLALGIIALARPQWGVVEEQVFDQSREVLIAVDLSRSMMAEDVKPSRLERSKLLITSLLDRLKGERVGLVLFAGTSFLQSPLSADYEILREFLPALKPEYLPEGGSNYKAMLETSIEAFGTSAADRYLIVLSDGESTEEGWKDLSVSLRNKGIRVIGLGIGTAQGSFIPDGSGGLIKDERGAVVLSRLNSSTLQELAQTTGGAYSDASAWIDLPALLRSTVEAGRTGEFSEKNTARKIERFQWFLAPALLLLLVSFWAEFPVRPRERALPLGGKMRNAERGMRNAQGLKTAAVLAALFWLSAFSAHPSANAQAQPPPGAPDDTLAKPLTTTVARLAEQDTISPKQLAELAQTTITYGQRLKTAQQPAPEGVIRDALTAVDAGEQADAKAADWQRLRQELEALREKPEQPPQDEKQQQQDQQQKQDEQKQDRQDQQQDQSQQDQQQSSQDQKSEQQQQQDQKQDAFGDMQEPQDQPPQDGEKKDEPPPPRPETQKVGGQKERKSEQETSPELAMPLQKLDQVRNQDSPAKLQLLMQGQQQKPSKKGKDW